MERCARCVLPSSRPDTAFVDGVCSACIAYEQRQDIDWEARRKDLERLLDEHHGIEYDCIVPSSGGKDSHYQVKTLLDLGAKPLVVTATTCHLTPIGRRNIDNLSRYADTIEITPNREVRAKLNRLALEMVGDISWPEHVLIHTVPFKIACNMGVPLVFYGENPTNQYGGPTAERQQEQKMTRRWVSEFGGFLGMRPDDWVGIDGILDGDMDIYRGVDDYQIEKAGIEVYFLGQFIPWDSHRNAAIAAEMGMEQQLPSDANIWRSENLDNAQTGIHDYFMFLKYRYGRGCAQQSVDIRGGWRSRETALAWVERFDGNLSLAYAGVRLDDVLERVGLTMARFQKIADEYRRRVA